MSKSGPIIIVEDDIDDKEMFNFVIKDLGMPNKLIWFENTDDAIKYLRETGEQPFIIFCDVNMPGKNGLEFKKHIDNDIQLRRKSIPFVFYSTSANQRDVNEAYTQMTVQGYFKKSISMQEMKSNIKLILDYWKSCIHPNTL